MSKRESALLRREERRGREGLRKAVRRLRTDASTAADVRSWAREFPRATLGATALAGLAGGFVATRKALRRRSGKKTPSARKVPPSVTVGPPPRDVVVEHGEGRPDATRISVEGSRQGARKSRRGRRRAGKFFSTASTIARRLPHALSLLSAAGAHQAAQKTEDAARESERREEEDEETPYGPSEARPLSPEEAALALAAMRAEGAGGVERSGFREPPRDPYFRPHAHGATAATATRTLPPASPGATAWFLLRQTLAEFVDDKAFRLSAALAYYTVFSLAPLLVIAIAVAGLLFAERPIEDDVLAWMRETVGPSAASTLETMIAQIQRPASGTVAFILGLAVLFFGASGLFYQLKDALNTVWDVPPEKGYGIVATLRNRGVAFLLVLVVGLLLVLSLVATALVTGLWTTLGGAVSVPGWLLELANFSVSFAVITLLFAVIYKLLPDTRIVWRDVWIGAIVTALLFAAGNFAIGLYLGRAASSSTFAAAGSLAIILVWAYYSALIFLLGAEFTHVYARSFGSLRPGGSPGGSPR